MSEANIPYLKSIRNILVIFLAVTGFVLLHQLSHLLLPLVLAGLLTILALPLVNILEKIRIPRFLITLLVAVLTLGLLWVVVSLISGTVQQIVSQRNVLARQLAQKINMIFLWAAGVIPGFDAESFWVETAKVLTPQKISGFIATALGTLGDFGSSFMLFLIYYLIFLSGATGYKAYVEYVTGQEGNRGTREIWHLTQESFSAYMGIKTLISLLTGVIAGVVCALFGLQFALFWGFLAFLMNFIPSIGSILATLCPALMALIQFDSAGMVLGLVALLGLSQFLIGSVLDPMIMGNRLRLNTITVIFGLLFWGYIWGIPGMLLSVPLMVMVRLILERSEDLSILARIMGNPVKQQRKNPALYTRIVDKNTPQPDAASSED